MPTYDELKADEEFKKACWDYSLFLELGYPEKPLCKLVGDRYRLESEKRLMLFRGICVKKVSERRRSRIISNDAVRGNILIVDGYNVILTILHYLTGKILFIGSDGFLRDVGASHGRISNSEAFERSIDIWIKSLKSVAPAFVCCLFDAPVSGSGQLSVRISKEFSDIGLRGSVKTAVSADYAIKECAKGHEAFPERLNPYVASSDSALIDSVQTAFFDMARFCLESVFQACFIDLASFCASNPYA